MANRLLSNQQYLPRPAWSQPAHEKSFGLVEASETLMCIQIGQRLIGGFIKTCQRYVWAIPKAGIQTAHQIRRIKSELSTAMTISTLNRGRNTLSDPG